MATSTQPNTTTTTTTLPTIHLLCRFQRDAIAFQDAIQKYYPTLPTKTKITIHNSTLAALAATTKFDAIVSPAKSYRFMDGAFDDAISVLLSPNPRDISGRGYQWTTRKVQAVLYERWRGYAPVGSCTVVDVGRDGEWVALREERGEVVKDDGGDEDEDGGHKHGCKFILLCPTMRVPREVTWDKEVVFECIWSLLCAVDNHNRERSERSESNQNEQEQSEPDQHEQEQSEPDQHEQEQSELDQHEQEQEQEQEQTKPKPMESKTKNSTTKTNPPIKSILLTPLATGVGRTSPARCAAQTILAIKYWLEAVEQPQKWANLQWSDVYGEMAQLIDGSVEL